jgi:hypothetical protein
VATACAERRSPFPHDMQGACEMQRSLRSQLLRQRLSAPRTPACGRDAPVSRTPPDDCRSSRAPSRARIAAP